MAKQQISEAAATALSAAELRLQLSQLEATKRDLEAKVQDAELFASDSRAAFEAQARKFALGQGPLPERSILGAAECGLQGLMLLVSDQDRAIAAISEKLNAAARDETIAAETDRLECLRLQARREFRDLEVAQERLRKAAGRLETTSWSDINKQLAIDERRAAEIARDGARQRLEQTLLELRTGWLTEANEVTAREEAAQLQQKARILAA